MRPALLGFTLVCLATPVVAQRPTPPDRGRAMLMARIDLTPTQRLRLDSLWAEHERQMAPLRERMRAAPGDSALRLTRDAMHEQMMARIRAELTPEQQVVFDRNRAEMEQRRRQGGPGRMGAGAPPPSPPPPARALTRPLTTGLA